RLLDDMPAEAGEIARAGAAGIDKGSCAAARRELGGVDSERGPAPIDMGVQVDEAGHDDEAARIEEPRPLQRQIGPDRRNPAALKPDIGCFVAPVFRIDDPAALEDQIQHRPPPCWGEPTQRFAAVKARGGGGPFPKTCPAEAASPKAALTPLASLPG